MNQSSAEIAALVRDVQETEHKYLLHGPRHDPIFNPWMPYQPADFIGIVWECMPELNGVEFLDVGCGPGTKMQIAAALFGLNPIGVEIDLEMAREARKRTPALILWENAIDSPDHFYGLFDLIWLYRPFRDSERERALELHILNAMQPGAILAGGSWETDVPGMGWQPIVDDCIISPDGTAKIFRGAWQKPA